MANFFTTEIGSLSEFTHQLETRISDNYRLLLFRGQCVDMPLIPGIARYLFKKSREVDEKRMLKEFNVQSMQYLSYYPKNQLEELAIAQHYGVPTRLLDWTENALAALYFAVAKETLPGDKAVVWVLGIERDSPLLVVDQVSDLFKQDELKVFKPSSIIQRVSSQHGWFSLHPLRGNGFYQRIDQITSEYRLNKIQVKHGCASKILHTLESCGINRHTIFRDLDSLGKYIFDKYRKV